MIKKNSEYAKRIWLYIKLPEDIDKRFNNCNFIKSGFSPLHNYSVFCSLKIMTVGCEHY